MKLLTTLLILSLLALLQGCINSPANKVMKSVNSNINSNHRLQLAGNGIAKISQAGIRVSISDTSRRNMGTICIRIYRNRDVVGLMRTDSRTTRTRALEDEEPEFRQANAAVDIVTFSRHNRWQHLMARSGCHWSRQKTKAGTGEQAQTNLWSLRRPCALERRRESIQSKVCYQSC